LRLRDLTSSSTTTDVLSTGSSARVCLSGKDRSFAISLDSCKTRALLVVRLVKLGSDWFSITSSTFLILGAQGILDSFLVLFLMVSSLGLSLTIIMGSLGLSLTIIIGSLVCPNISVLFAVP
jgi:hypothetical protein